MPKSSKGLWLYSNKSSVRNISHFFDIIKHRRKVNKLSYQTPSLAKLFSSLELFQNTVLTKKGLDQFYVCIWHEGSDLFRSSHFSFLVFGHFWWRFTKIRKYYVIFVYIWQGKMGKREKNGAKLTQLKWPKYQKPKFSLSS